MARYRGPRLKVCRQVGVVLPGLTNKGALKRPFPPGQHGTRRKGKQSDFKDRMVEKQKFRLHYGILEKQFRRYVAEASRRKGETGRNLISMLESRLDTVVYRSKFDPTIFAARQFVNHGHVTLNGKKANIASMLVKPGDVVQVRERSRNMALVIEAMSSGEREVPEYVEVDQKAGTAKFVRMPALSDIPYAARMEPNLVVEFYSS
jgi:small subunit ribosomal protein S4